MINFLKIVYSYALTVLLFPLRIFPVRKDRIVFAGLTGGDAYEYSCNPKYICEHIRREYPGRFQIYWVVSKPERYRGKEGADITFLKHYSLRSFYYLMTAKVIVTSGSYAPWFPFRRRQYLINTWHGGGAYKRLKDNYGEAGKLQRKKLKFCADNISLFLSSCERATKCLFRGAFHYQGEIMETGMPRNDCLVAGDTQEAAGKVRAFYGIPQEDKLVLYAPTYRSPSREIVLKEDALIKVLERDGARWHLLFRAHRYQEKGASIRVAGNHFLNAGEYPDMQELLAAADMLITDYSSAVWDYSFLYRPCFLFVPDLKEYLDKTGFYTDIHRWPFSMAENQGELEKLILNYDGDAAREKIRLHHCEMGNCESGHACESVTKRILEICK